MREVALAERVAWEVGFAMLQTVLRSIDKHHVEPLVG